MRFVGNENVAIDGKATGEHGLFCPGKTYIASPENIIGARRLWPAHSRGLYRIKIGAERIHIVALCLCIEKRFKVCQPFWFARGKILRLRNVLIQIIKRPGEQSEELRLR